MRIRRSFTPEQSAQVARRDGGQPFFNAAGQLNASNNADAMQALGVLAAMVQSGQLTMQGAEDIQSQREESARKSEIVTAAFHGNDDAWYHIGANIGARVTEAADREGFMRNLLVNGEVQQSNFVRVRVVLKNVTALIASGPSLIYPAFVRDNYIYPPEWYIQASVFIEEREVQQGSAEVLDDAYNKALEQVMVEEDRTWKRMADATVGLENTQVALSGGLTPSTLASMRSDVTRWNIAPVTILMASNLWTDIIGNAAAFANLFDPVTQFEIIQTGRLGTLLGLDIRTDAYRHPQLQVLSAGEFYIIGPPEMHGTYTDRGPVVADELTTAIQRTPGRGWIMHELMSMVLHNPRSLVKGVRS